MPDSSDIVHLGGVSFQFMRVHRAEEFHTRREVIPSRTMYFDVLPVRTLAHCPLKWRTEAYLIFAHSNEALWIVTDVENPVAAYTVDVDGYNALTGTHNYELESREQNYLVTPGQHYLEYYRGRDEKDHQFLAPEAEESSSTPLLYRQLEFSVHLPIVPHKAPYAGFDLRDVIRITSSKEPGARLAPDIDSVVHIEPDPYTKPGQSPGDTWKLEPSAKAIIYLVNVCHQERLTGERS